MSARRHLRSVDVDSVSGEIVEACPHVAGCEHCSDREYALDQLERKYQGALSKIGRLERDEEEEARRHKLWDEAECVHSWWRIACGHPGVKFGADQFYQALPRLKEREVGVIGMLRAVAGAAYDPNTKRMKNGRIQRFDSWELVTRSQEKCRSFMERAPGREDGEEWKRWLVDRIEEGLES